MFQAIMPTNMASTTRCAAGGSCRMDASRKVIISVRSNQVDEHAANKVGDRQAMMIDVMVARMKERYVIGKQQQQRCADTFEPVPYLHGHLF